MLKFFPEPSLLVRVDAPPLSASPPVVTSEYPVPVVLFSPGTAPATVRHLYRTLSLPWGLLLSPRLTLTASPPASGPVDVITVSAPPLAGGCAQMAVLPSPTPSRS